MNCSRISILFSPQQEHLIWLLNIQLRKAKRSQTNKKKTQHWNKTPEETLLLIVWQPKNDLSNIETGYFKCEYIKI